MGFYLGEKMTSMSGELPKNSPTSLKEIKRKTLKMISTQTV
jgi:hypothetical protein